MPDMVVIGMGHLARYLMPGFRLLVGDAYEKHVWGTVKHQETAIQLRGKIPFPVSADDTLEVLQRTHPDIILVAVPPKSIPGVIRQTLGPYYGGLRHEGRRLPDIYSFGPSPSPDLFSDILGDDVYAAKILPAMTKKCRGVGFITWNRPFPADKRERALRFSDCFNRTVELTHRDSLYALASKVSAYSLTYMAMDTADVAGITHGEVLTEMLSALSLSPDKGTNMGPVLQSWIDKLARSWYRGIREGDEAAGLGADSIYMFFAPNFKAAMVDAMLLDREDIHRKFKMTATKGGVTEKGRRIYQDGLEEELKNKARSAASGKSVPESFFQLATRTAQKTLTSVVVHAFHLADKKE